MLFRSDHGYTTLSVQMPVLAATATGDEYPALFGVAAARLAAAAAFLRAKGHARIALASHSVGARIGNHFLAAHPELGIAAFVAVGVSSGLFADAERLQVPVLDIYGAQDFPQVLANADARARAIARLKGSAQIEVPAADHYFTGRETELAQRVRQFLDRTLR